MRTILLLAALLVCQCLFGSAQGQSLFLTGGIGGTGIAEGTGISVGLGGGGMYGRVLGFVNAAEVTIIHTDQGNGRDYYRDTLPDGQSRCFDRQTGLPLGPSLQLICDVTNFEYAAAGDLNLFLAGNFFAGGGVRVGSEISPYLSLGFTWQTLEQPRYTFAPLVRGAVGKGLWAATLGAALRLR
jgi:hypothetical protein